MRWNVPHPTLPLSWHLLVTAHPKHPSDRNTQFSDLEEMGEGA